MNPRLTRTQIDEIFAAAEHVDVPVEQLLDAAAEIRAALLGSSDVVLDLTQPSEEAIAPPPPRVGGLRHARAVRTTFVAATLALALVISTAVSGALPDPIQDRVSRVANLFGLDLPVGGPAGAAPAPNGTSQPTAGEGAARRATDPGAVPPGTDAPFTLPAVLSRATDGTAATTLSTKPHLPPEASVPATPTGNEPVAVPGASNGNGPPEDPGNGNGNGPPENPGTPNGNGPPEYPGTPNGNGPPENPGNGNDNGPTESSDNGG